MSPIHSSRIYKDHFTILAFSAIYPFFSRPSSSIIIIIDDDDKRYFDMPAMKPTFSTAQAGLSHHGSLPLPMSPCSPFPVPLWTDELESEDFLKWMKTKETHSSSGSDASGRVFVV